MNYFPFTQLRAIEKMFFVKFLFSKLITFYLLVIIFFNYINFKQKRHIFINSFAFGHSIQETSIFFAEYPNKSICISVGSRKHRNQYLSLLYKPFIVINFRLPNIPDINIYHAIRKRCHLNIEYTLKNSRLISFLMDSKLDIIDREILLHNSALKCLNNTYSVSISNATKFIEKINDLYVASSSHNGSCALHLLTQQRSPILPNQEAIQDLNKKFIQSARFQRISNSQSKKICTLIIRKSWKAWSGNGLESYLDAIKYLNQNNYVVNIIGDIEEFGKMREIYKFEAAFCNFDYGYNNKIFQILSIMNSEFCLGDISGLLPLSLFFNKKNLIINSVPFGHVYYNSVALPRLWCWQNGTPVNKLELVDNLLYRIHPFESFKSSSVFPKYHDAGTILKALEIFLSDIQTKKDIDGVEPNKFFPTATLANYSTKAFYSPIINDFYH